MTGDALQRAIADACLRARAGDALAGGLRAFLEGHGVGADDVEAIMSAPRTLAVYRSLVRNGVSAVVLRMLPRTRARMNAACAGRFDADFADFLDQVGPRTHHLRDVPAELLAWAAPRWRSDPSVPAYLPELAAH
ncbi:MAG TPA: putative DNA-binding domain-containing protein, partial [Polyangiaceae bacterium]|nr:putative DNA-binding domain-containing protein [Polyangiaceae bacterium]